MQLLAQVSDTGDSCQLWFWSLPVTADISAVNKHVAVPVPHVRGLMVPAVLLSCY